ncbi:MAG: hypothetical protein LOD92_08860 [Bacillales bacterium]
MKKRLWSALLLTAFMAACQANHADEMTFEKTANRQKMASRFEHAQEQETNPAGQRQNAAGLNHKHVTAQIQKIVSEAGDFTLDSVMVNGTDLWVFVHTTRPLSQREIIQENAALTKKLNEAFPKFRANVKVEQSWQPPVSVF